MDYTKKMRLRKLLAACVQRHKVLAENFVLRRYSELDSVSKEFRQLWQFVIES